MGKSKLDLAHNSRTAMRGSTGKRKSKASDSSSIQSHIKYEFQHDPSPNWNFWARTRKAPKTERPCLLYSQLVLTQSSSYVFEIFQTDGILLLFMYESHSQGS